MGVSRIWTINVCVSDGDGEARAVASVRAGRDRFGDGRGSSHPHPDAGWCPHVGEEVAVARALTDLAMSIARVADAERTSRSHHPAGLGRR